MTIQRQSLSVRMAQSIPAHPVEPVTSSILTTQAVVGLMGSHALLALLIYRFPGLATLHAAAALAVGLGAAALGRRVLPAACAAAYLVSAEVLWRMTQARVFWEFGKYAVIAVLGLALLRFFKGWRRLALPLAYVTFLLPAAWVTSQALGLSDAAREAISFNLSGPMALAVCAVFFLQGGWSRREVRDLLWIAVLPVCGIATIALYTTLGATDINFTQESNFVTSGGFGPNQVSAALGFGALLCILVAIHEPRPMLRWLATGLGLWFMAHAMLTLSRGGLYTALAALILLALQYLRRPGVSVGPITAGLALVLVFGYFIYPQLNTFTEGALEQRFTEIDTTGRVAIARADLAVWGENWLFGVGAGMSPDYRSTFLVGGQAAHTEFTRLLAEHGLAGGVAIGLLLLMGWRAYRKAPGIHGKAWVAALAGWALIEISHNAMRIAAISFAFGLAMLVWERGRTPASVTERAAGGRFERPDASLARLPG